MKSEDAVRMGVRIDDDASPPSFFATHATASHGADEFMKLSTENLRLKQLVAELLVENQQLRQRYRVSRTDGPSAGHHSDNRESARS
jgi:hypothetical protein